MLVLLIVGIGLIVFGGIVLLKFPHKPGGKISIGTFEVSSVGAGLPLMVLGVICIFFYSENNTLDVWPWQKTSLQNINGCFAQYFKKIPADRISKLEVGIRDQDLVSANQSKDKPIGILFMQNREPFGAIIFNFYSDNDIFKIESIVDSNCRQIETYSNNSRGGDKHILQNWDTVEMPIGDQSYFLRLGYDGGVVSANYFR